MFCSPVFTPSVRSLPHTLAPPRTRLILRDQVQMPAASLLSCNILGKLLQFSGLGDKLSFSYIWDFSTGTPVWIP